LKEDKREDASEKEGTRPREGERGKGEKGIQPSSEGGKILGSAKGDADAELRGRTLKAYLFILRRREPIGVRELQRGLSLSSPSVAYHHLEKLERFGLIEKNEYGQYAVTKDTDVAVLQAFSNIGGLLLPRFTFYAVFFTTLLLGYVLIFGGNSNLFAIAFGVFASIFAWYETLRTWKKRPF
jgi:DNA-binding transcriptional ArsR family regulator